MKYLALCLLALTLTVSAQAGTKKKCECYQETKGPFPRYWTSLCEPYVWWEKKRDCKNYLKERRKHPDQIVTWTAKLNTRKEQP